MTSRSPFSLHLIFDLVRKPLHSLLILLLLFSPAQSYAAVPRGGAESGTRPLGGAELPIPSQPGSAPSADPAAVAPGHAPGSGGEGTAPGALQSPETAASGLNPDIEALIAEEEGKERQEAQAAATASDGGGGGSGSGSISAGQASAPEVDLFTGSASLQVPILIPPGRRGATPDLKLVYSSSGGDSPFGYGWSFPIGSISRSTKFGVPGCPLNETDDKADFVIILNGSALELKRLHAGSTGTHIYRPRISESSLEVSAHTRRNEWDAYDRAGNHYYFGQVASARLHNGVDKFYNTAYNASTGANCEFTTMWMLTRFVDTNGNEIKYHYYKDVNTQNVIYPYYIDYGGNGGSASLREAPFRILFDHNISLINRDRGTPLDNPKISPWTRDSRSISYARGVLERRYYIIPRIRVFYRDRPGAGHKLIRQYKLDYLDDPYTGRNLLQRVRTLDPKGVALVPPQTFEYASSKLDFAPEVTVRGPLTAQDTGHLHHTDRDGNQTRALLDVNSDGYIDLIDSYSGGTVYTGTENGINGPTFKWKGGFNTTTPLVLVQHSSSKTDFLDMTGDGVPDRVIVEKGALIPRTRIHRYPWRIFPGSCRTPTQCGEGASFLARDLSSIPAAFVDIDTLTPLSDPNLENTNGYVRRLPPSLRQTSGGRISEGDWTSVLSSVMDMNSDGIVDAVGILQILDWFRTGRTFHRWSTFIGTGSSFTVSPFFSNALKIENVISTHIETTQQSGDQHITHRMTMDVNGDGLPDHLVYRWNHCVTFDHSGNVAGRYPSHNCNDAVKAFSIDRSRVVFTNVVDAYLNSGRGFDHHVTWYIPSWGGGANSNQGIRRTVDRRVSSQHREGNTVQNLIDINGDGLPDFIDVKAGRWRVTYNQGGVIDFSQNPTETLSGGNWISQSATRRRAGPAAPSSGRRRPVSSCSIWMVTPCPRSSTPGIWLTGRSESSGHQAEPPSSARVSW